jgi:hypothetical protein
MKTVLLVAVTALALAGCMTDRTKGLFNPPTIHASDDAAAAASIAGQVPVDQYYAAVKNAQAKAATDPEIGIMVDKGVGLVSAYCLRWFQRLDDSQRRFAMQQKDFNIIRDLGTALLGIGGANSTIVGTYGALNTAYTGIAENFNEAVLAGPTTAKIKSQMMDMLNQSEKQLRADAVAKSLTFTQAYNRIELHADTCTYSTVRNLLDATLNKTDAKRNPLTGQISVEVKSEDTFQFDDSSKRLKSFWWTDGAPNRTNEAALNKWLAQNGLASVSIPFFLNGAQFAQFRAKAVKDLNLP